MKVLYRISDAGYQKTKAEYINNLNCLRNASSRFSQAKWTIIADNISDSTRYICLTYHSNINEVSVGNGAGTFNIALDLALTFNDNEIVYFIENDYIHKEGSDKALEEVFSMFPNTFVTLYDHPDKYIPASKGGNPYIEEDGSEVTKVYLTESCHWKIVNSTTMTFAAKVSTLRKYEKTLRKWTSTSHPYDFDMWCDLRLQGATLLSPLPSYATHGDLPTIAPIIDWKKETEDNS